MLKRLALCVLLGIFALSASAQVATGLYPYGSFDNLGFDQVDRGSLNVHFAIPVFSKQGRGQDFQYSLVYDSLMWTPATVNGVTTWTPDPAFGLHGVLLNDGYRGYLSYTVTYIKCYSGGTLLGNYPIYRNYVYFDPNGTPHAFSEVNNTCTGVETGSTTATDGSGYVETGTGVLSVRGEQLAPPNYVNGAVATTNGSSTDANGNQITNDQNGIFTDTTGVQVLTASGSGTAASPKVLTYKTVGGTANVTLTYKTYTVQTVFGCSNVGDFNHAEDLPDRVTLADGSYYQFSYEATPGNSANVTGRLSSITLPTGGTITYNYSGGGINCADGTPTNLSHTTSDGTKNYARSSITSTTSHTDIADASSNHSTFDFVTANPGGGPAVFYETQEAWHTGSVSGPTLLSRQTCYNGAAAPCTTTALTLPIAKIDIYETLDGTQQHGSTVSFNSFGLETEKDDYDFGSGARGALIQKEVWSYPTTGIADLVSSDTVTDGQNNQISQTVYHYDETTPTPTSGLPQHVGPPDSQRGNITSVLQWVSTGYLTTTNAYDDTGQLLTSAGPAGTTTYGHDTTDTFTTSVTLPSTPSGIQLTQGAAYDINTGVNTSTTDANGSQAVASEFDALNRPQLITYQDVNHTVLGHDYLTYSPNQLIQAHDIDTTSARVQRYTLYDGYGRLSRVADENGQSSYDWYQMDYCYDANGRLTFQPVRYQGGGWATAKQCSGAGDTTTYDALDRITKVAHADGSSVAYSYTARASDVTDENGVSRILQVDGLGRLRTVCEISSAPMGPSGNPDNPAACGTDISGTGFLTQYAYANNTSTITQGLQTRVITNDSLGRLTSLQEPETGPATTFSYSYNSTGLQVVRKRVKANQASPTTLTTTTTQYDALGRILTITYDDGTPTKQFSYDDANYLNAPQVHRTNVKGRPSTAMTYVPNTSNMITGVQYSYDALGNITTMWECGAAATCGNGALARELIFGYDYAGRQTSEVDPFAGNISYVVSHAGEILSITNNTYNNSTNPGALVSSVQNGPFGPTNYQLGNSLSRVFTYDSVGRNQYTWLCAGGVKTSYCSGGTQLYGVYTQWKGSYLTNSVDTTENSGGNYTYDSLGHLSGYNGTIGSPVTYSWSYDRYGNRYGATPGANITVNKGNNIIQVSGFYNDAAGNETNDSVHSYAFDAEFNVISVDGGSTATYTYNALNERVGISNVQGSREFTYDYAGRRVGTWTPGTSTETQGQIWWGNIPVAYRDSDGTTYFQHADSEGTQRVLTNYAGSVASQYTSRPWGDAYAVSPTGGKDDNLSHYAGLEQSENTGILHAQYRDLDSPLGRWLSPDSYFGSYDWTNPQSFNRFSYALNNPGSLIDPSGLDPVCSMDPETGLLECTTSGPSCDTDPSASGCQIITWPCLEYGLCGGPTGSGPGYNPGTPLPPPPPPPHARKGVSPTGCKDDFYHSKIGKWIAAGSILSPIPGTNSDWKRNLFEWAAIPLLKGGAILLGSKTSAAVGSTEFQSVVAGNTIRIAGSGEAALGVVSRFITKAGPYVIAGATAVDLAQSAGCGIAQGVDSGSIQAAGSVGGLAF